MGALAGPFLAASLLLVGAGMSKIVDPAPLVRAARSVGLPVPTPAVRVLAALEAGLGVAAVLTGSRVAAALVALSYLGFTGFVLLARRRGGVLASCGCFGKVDTPPTRTHIAVTGVLAVVAAAVAVRPVGGLQLNVAFLTATAATTVVLYVVLALLPGLTEATRAGSRVGAVAARPA